MPAFPGTEQLPHFALLWAAIDGQFDEFGEQIVESNPEEINCWVSQTKQETKEGEMDSFSNETAISDEIIVDRPVACGSRMWIGRLKPWQLGKRGGDILYVKSYEEETDAVTGEVLSMTCELERLRIKL